MRVIVSEKVAELFKSMSQEKLLEIETPVQNIRRRPKRHSIDNTHMSPSSINFTTAPVSPNHFRTINIKHKKITVPKNISEKYNNDHQDGSGRLLPNVYLSLNNDNSKSSAFSSIKNHTEDTSLNKIQYSLKDLIKKDTLKNMTTQMKQEREMKNKLSDINENNFRSPYKEKDFMREIKEKMEKKVSLDKVNLIHYITHKSKISENFVKQLSTFNEERMNKLNKICQIINHREEKQHLFENEIKNIIQGQLQAETEDYKKQLARMSGDLHGIDELLKKNKKFDDKRERYVYIHRDIKNKFWDKYGVERLYSPTKRRSCSKTIDVSSNGQSVNISKLLS
jgi:hypothetical protein